MLCLLEGGYISAGYALYKRPLAPSLRTVLELDAVPPAAGASISNTCSGQVEPWMRLIVLLAPA